MSTGSQSDIVSRLQSYLPARWFGDFSLTPVIVGVLNGIASTLAISYMLIQFFRAQTRLQTSSSGWVDLWAYDFFGLNLPRNLGETDSAYIARIKVALFQQRVTRQAMINVLTNLTGNAPVIFEPNRPLDSGCFGLNQGPNSFFGVARFGSIGCPYSALITVNVATPAGSSYGGAFFNAIAVSAFNTVSPNAYFVSLSEESSVPTTAAIYAAINATRPAASNIGVAIVV